MCIMVQCRDGNQYHFIDTNSIIDSPFRSSSLLIPLLIPDHFFVSKKVGLHSHNKVKYLCVFSLDE